MTKKHDETNDTSSTIQKMLIEGYRKMNPQQKLIRINELTKAVQHVASIRIQQTYGPLSEKEMRLRLASLWLQRELMIKIFQWDPQEKGY